MTTDIHHCERCGWVTDEATFYRPVKCWRLSLGCFGLILYWRSPEFIRRWTRAFRGLF